jgi:hypothetical protein
MVLSVNIVLNGLKRRVGKRMVDIYALLALVTQE